MDNNKKSKNLDTGGILFALFIVLLGAFALLFETPILTGLLHLVQFWPLILIGIGVWLIFKNMEREKIGAVVLAVLLIGAMYYAFSRPTLELESFEERHVPEGVTSMEVSMDLIAGSFSIGPTSEYLYASRGYNYPMESLMSTRGSTAVLSLAVEEEAFIPFSEPGHEYEILLNGTLSASLYPDAVASSCSFDLSALNLTELDLEAVVSSIDMTLGEMSTDINLEMVLSTLDLYVPQSVGVKIISDGLVSLTVPSGWIKLDDGYKSPNYDNAQYKINITCDVAMGVITISYI